MYHNLWFFGPFLDVQEFFKNRGLSFETLDSDFRDLLGELFHMVKKIFRKKSKLQVLFQSPKLKTEGTTQSRPPNDSNSQGQLIL